jgi:hypothetical protein
MDACSTYVITACIRPIGRASTSMCNHVSHIWQLKIVKFGTEILQPCMVCNSLCLEHFCTPLYCGFKLKSCFNPDLGYFTYTNSGQKMELPSFPLSPTEQWQGCRKVFKNGGGGGGGALLVWRAFLLHKKYWWPNYQHSLGGHAVSGTDCVIWIVHMCVIYNCIIL